MKRPDEDMVIGFPGASRTGRVPGTCGWGIAMDGMEA